jgi:hypothetical protein
MRQIDPMYIDHFDGDVVALTDTNVHDLRAADANDTQIVRVLAVQNLETTDEEVVVGLTDGTTTLACTVSVPLSSGNVAGTALFDLLAAAEMAPLVEEDDAGNPMITLPVGWSLTITRSGANTNGMVALSKAEVWGDGVAAA